MKYRKKPVVIDAIQLTTHNIKEVLEFRGQKVVFAHDMDRNKFEEYCDIVREKGMDITTLEGITVASIDDFVIKGVKGEFYACKPDIFEMTYEKVGD
jgi:hypothetical protein